jgi:hypothetical protein
MQGRSGEIEQAYTDKNVTSQQPVPRVLWIVGIASIKKNGPLITRDGDLSRLQLLSDTVDDEY